METLLKNNVEPKINITAPVDLTTLIDTTIKDETLPQRHFLLAYIQIKNLETYQKNRSPLVTRNLIREFFFTFKRFIHPSHTVGLLNGGIGILFVDVTEDKKSDIEFKLKKIGERIILEGQYNNVQNRWDDILTAFLHPQKGHTLSTNVTSLAYSGYTKSAECLIKELLQKVR